MLAKIKRLERITQRRHTLRLESVGLPLSEQRFGALHQAL